MNCVHLRIRTKDYKKYIYCNHPKEMKKMKQGDFWLDELVEYKLNTEEIQKIMESLKKKEEKKYEQSIGDGTAVFGVIEH